MDERVLRVLEFDKIKDKVAEYCQTAAGKQKVKDLRPYGNAYDATVALKETNGAVELINKKGMPPFEGIYDVRNEILMAKKGANLTCSGIFRMGGLLRCSRRFIDYAQDNYLDNICRGITTFKRLEDEIFNAIVSEDEISDRATETLFNLRRELKTKNASVKDRVNSLIRKYSKLLQDDLYTMRGDRYVIPVKSENKSAVPGIVHDQSASGATLFIEPMSLVELNNDIRELMLKEKAEIERILANLSRKIYDNIDGIAINADIVWELDFIFAKAHYASEVQGTCPHMTEDGSFEIKNGRHPLIDDKVVVPITVYLGKEYSSLIITGPNTGGKTVTLKTVGLLHIMAMSGLFIPADDNSTVSYYDNIFADIGDEQSIEQNLSTFSSHMKNIVYIMDKADDRSLALFDELGAGTDPVEGAALAIAILDNLKLRGSKIVATTHYSELKAYALSTEGVENASMEFDVETLKPTYRLLVGIPGKSNAFEISKRLGLTNNIIEDAKKNVSNTAMKFEDLIMTLQQRTIEAEDNLREAASMKMEAKTLKEKYEKKFASFEKNKDNMIQNANREAKQVIRQAKEEADDILKNIRELEKIGYGSDVSGKLENERRKLRDKLDVMEAKTSYKKDVKPSKTPKKVELGQELILNSLNQKVTVLTLPDSKGDLQVQAGIMKVSVNLKDLSEGSGVANKNISKKEKREVKLNLSRVESSVDLRGLDAEEAMYKVDKYLDDAYMAGLGEVTIIHGKGTGILRNAITDMLKHHPHVKSHRLGGYSEGGTGATVVELK
ncbi:endonuclease MutS2 [Clostridium oryzae]|uniref:Endonuclease MutS2 n=1 Tax=Clostridium oryzae TaxID=1450648 RepID=A0A1V4IDB6_9CLOT|nr:endonuclease MutS2 [Clostridium oryzae]OPJ57507.1 endonuclease MutS2 [Clostridium oryzae]